MTVLAWGFSDYHNSVNLGSKPMWKLPTGQEIAELTWFLKIHPLRAKVIRTLLFLRYGVDFFLLDLLPGSVVLSEFLPNAG